MNYDQHTFTPPLDRLLCRLLWWFGSPSELQRAAQFFQDISLRSSNKMGNIEAWLPAWLYVGGSVGWQVEGGKHPYAVALAIIGQGASLTMWYTKPLIEIPTTIIQVYISCNKAAKKRIPCLTTLTLLRKCVTSAASSRCIQNQLRKLCNQRYHPHCQLPGQLRLALSSKITLTTFTSL